MKNKVKKIGMVMIFILLIGFIFSNYSKATISNIFLESDLFLANGGAVEETIDDTKLQETSKFLYKLLLAIGIIVMFIIGTILGIKFMLASAEDKAKIKELLIPYVVGCFVIFGGFVIWKNVVNIGEDVFSAGVYEEQIKGKVFFHFDCEHGHFDNYKGFPFWVAYIGYNNSEDLKNIINSLQIDFSDCYTELNIAIQIEGHYLYGRSSKLSRFTITDEIWKLYDLFDQYYDEEKGILFDQYVEIINNRSEEPSDDESDEPVVEKPLFTSITFVYWHETGEGLCDKCKTKRREFSWGENISDMLEYMDSTYNELEDCKDFCSVDVWAEESRSYDTYLDFLNSEDYDKLLALSKDSKEDGVEGFEDTNQNLDFERATDEELANMTVCFEWSSYSDCEYCHDEELVFEAGDMNSEELLTSLDTAFEQHIGDAEHCKVKIHIDNQGTMEYSYLQFLESEDYNWVVSIFDEYYEETTDEEQTDSKADLMVHFYYEEGACSECAKSFDFCIASRENSEDFLSKIENRYNECEQCKSFFRVYISLDDYKKEYSYQEFLESEDYDTVISIFDQY